MQKNAVIWIVIAILIVAGIMFAVTKSSQEKPPIKSETSTTSVTEVTTTPTPTPTEQVVVAETKNNCTRNYNPNFFTGKTVDYKNKQVTLTVRGFGDIVIEPNDVSAPKTSENFVKLVESGFYNCLIFHRLSNLTGDPKNPGRIIQGGDPEGTGRGGPGYTVPAEIGLKHVKGAIAMARTGDAVNPKRESSGSQFYIAVDAVPFLDDQYTVFGIVTKGLDIAEKISNAPILGGSDGPPKDPIVIEKAVVSNR